MFAHAPYLNTNKLDKKKKKFISVLIKRKLQVTEIFNNFYWFFT